MSNNVVLANDSNCWFNNLNQRGQGRDREGQGRDRGGTGRDREGQGGTGRDRETQGDRGRETEGEREREDEIMLCMVHMYSIHYHLLLTNYVHKLVWISQSLQT